jgi:hypothetical protein
MKSVEKMYKYLSLMLLLLSSVAISNDCIVILGSSDEIVSVQATNISMREEEIIITLHKDYYEVDVTFDFFNNGAEEKVLLGFPVKDMVPPALDDKIEVYDFKSYVNGEAIPVNTTKKNTVSQNTDKKYKKWFIRDVMFPANSRTVSRVTYKSKYSYCGWSSLAGYIYGTGRFWKGGIGKMTVIINHGDDMLIELIGFGEAKPSEFIWEANGKYKYVFESVNPTHDDESISIEVQRFTSGLYGKYDEEFGVQGSEYSWLWSEYLLYKNPTDIRHYTKNQIRLFINFFFALHGYDFKNSLYKEYFQKLKSFDDKDYTKYKVNPNFKESDFNEIERKNIDYLLKLEKMIPQ